MSITTYLSADRISTVVDILADQISAHYLQILEKDETLMLIVILKGSSIFYADLVRRLKIPVETEFISISSYGSDMESSGQVRFELDTRRSIKGRHVLIIEDIIDTGNSLKVVLGQFKAREPKSLEITTLLSKPSRRKVEIGVKFVGLTIPDEFVVGYGLDYDEKYRELPYIGILKL